ncbi:MAG: Hsp20/alpha crystallin family protein [Candidatus Gastranaerophilales bacterium]|nr:Hsp20/alpha crystallin family protein [Candidatus Gastranaerophilales bacterium]
MDENKKHCLLKYLGVVFATLIGAYLAFYCAVHTTIDRVTNPYNVMHRMDKMMMKAGKDFDKTEGEFFDGGMPLKCKNHKHFHHHDVISFFKTPDSYKFIVDLKPFHGNANAIRVETKDGLITISGETTSNKKNEEYFTQVSQSYLLDNDANIEKISKKKVNNKYIITIPIED